MRQEKLALPRNKTIAQLRRLRKMGCEFIRTDDDGESWIGTTDAEDGIPIDLLIISGAFQGKIVMPCEKLLELSKTVD
ncbi:hypothetical protein Enr13x_72560 [Stieleria neptunia]|uniref:Uncharacterized protein n=1 Tax=Stieleria neptunia TaxID=2527979 RepID=A0A518I2V0_9BACT|nr:hypothetical protein [Stieleria neptunia]QDV47347.1 hypothetical protein Enr13x_72560 [Stieleria neptunia]